MAPRRGVEYAIDGRRQNARGNGEVIGAGGTINSPSCDALRVGPPPTLRTWHRVVSAPARPQLQITRVWRIVHSRQQSHSLPRVAANI